MKMLPLFSLVFLVAQNSFAYLPMVEQIRVNQLKLNTVADTPDFTAKQKYLEASPAGINARAAWALAGGRGENVKIIDVECGIEERHEDLGSTFFMGANPWDGDDHGTAVYGVIRGTADAKGVTGIANQSHYGFVGFKEGMNDPAGAAYTAGMVQAIRTAVSRLSAGDVIVIEQHVDGPDAKKLTAPEYYDEIFAELKAATAKGIHCVAAAGNGSSNFDSPAYGGAFDLKKRDSGCIIVGAGAASDHSPLYFTNYGSRVDVQGYGENVTTTGYGDAFNGGKTRTYTSQFNGTSSATPVVAGAVAVISSAAKARGKLVTPAQLREALRNTGTPAGGASKKRIGNLPDILAALKYLKIYK